MAQCKQGIHRWGRRHYEVGVYCGDCGVRPRELEDESVPAPDAHLDDDSVLEMPGEDLE